MTIIYLSLRNLKEKLIYTLRHGSQLCLRSELSITCYQVSTSHMIAYQILPSTELISHQLRSKLKSLIKRQLCGSQHEPYTLHLSFHSSPFRAVMQAWATWPQSLWEEGGGKQQTDRQKEKESSNLAESQVSLKEVGLIHQECLFPCESGLALGLACKKPLPSSLELVIWSHRMYRTVGLIGQ